MTTVLFIVSSSYRVGKGLGSTILHLLERRREPKSLLDGSAQDGTKTSPTEDTRPGVQYCTPGNQGRVDTAPMGRRADYGHR